MPNVVATWARCPAGVGLKPQRPTPLRFYSYLRSLILGSTLLMDDGLISQTDIGVTTSKAGYNSSERGLLDLSIVHSILRFRYSQFAFLYCRSV